MDLKEGDRFGTFTKRRWGVLPILDYYILHEFLVHASILVLVFIILFIVGDVFNDLQDFLEKQAKPAQMVSYFLLKLPGNLRFVLPISMLLACMWTMANFGKHMEVTAMRASGVSLFRCGGSILMVGLIVTFMNFWFNEKLVPYTQREAEVLMCRATNTRTSVTQDLLTYRSTDKKRTWLFKYFDANGAQKSVTLKCYRSNGSLKWDIQAATAMYSPEKGWQFENGGFTPYSRDGLMPKNSRRFKSIATGEKNLPDEFKEDIGEITETPEDIMNAIKAPEDLPSWVIWDMLEKTKDMAKSCKAMYSTILYYRLAFPWACFLAVFLGIPLATKNERSGIFLAIISAVGIIIVYQVTSEIFLILGKQGLMNPMIAGLSPTVAFIIFGWYNVVKQRL